MIKAISSDLNCRLLENKPLPLAFFVKSGKAYLLCKEIKSMIIDIKYGRGHSMEYKKGHLYEIQQKQQICSMGIDGIRGYCRGNHVLLFYTVQTLSPALAPFLIF